MSEAGYLELHASLVAQDGRGILLRGPSGAGKSDLALRLIDRGFALVADDRVRLHAVGGRLVGTAPPALAGLLEVRGIGLFRLPALAAAPVVLLAELATGARERLPEPRQATFCGIAVPVLTIFPLHASAAAALALALSAAPVAGALGDAA